MRKVRVILGLLVITHRLAHASLPRNAFTILVPHCFAYIRTYALGLI